MGLEIERKFLVRSDAWRAAATRTLRMRQGYLSVPGGAASVRVRLEGDEARLNIKAAVVGASRAEYEYPIPVADARQMLEGLCVGRVDKQRHFVDHGGHTWEVDEFAGDNAGLVVAEIELEAEHAAFPRPPWLGAEVTNLPRYYNHALALHPYCRWSDAERNDSTR